MTTVDDLVDVTRAMSLDSQGRLMLAGRALHGCCLEAADGPHGDCDFSQFVNLPPAARPQRTFIPHKRKETDGG
jgi:hypothetical protein